jgi:MoxR-like ATPase
MNTAELEKTVVQFREEFARLKAEIGKVVVGHAEVLEGVLMTLFCSGHVLLEGVPGLGKTLLVRTLSQALSLRFSRIQFTPDLMPADILGTNLVNEDQATGKRSFEFQPGPIFGQIVLADEVNRATPKTQSALLEAMQEHSVTIAGKRYALEQPFIVLATQNPLEMEGTYPLPEAQLDRFLLKIMVRPSQLEDLKEVLTRTTETRAPEASKVMDGPAILRGRELVRQVVAASHVKDYCARVVLATHPQGPHAVEATNRFVRYGASPRGAQAILLTSKVRALLASRYNVAFEDVKAVAHAALRHRIILNFEAEAEGVTTDAVIDKVLAGVPTEAQQQAATA